MKRTIIIVAVSILTLAVGSGTWVYFHWRSLLPGGMGQIGQLMAGERLSAQEVADLEEKVKADPEDMDDRLSLLGYYFMRSWDSVDIQKARDVHILWLIKNRPGSEVAGMPYGHIESLRDPGFQDAKDAWLEQVQKNQQDPKIIWNAANAFTLTDQATCETLLLKGAALEPSDQKWPFESGHLYSLQHDYTKSFAYYEKAYGLAKTNIEKRSILPTMAKCAVEAGELEKAKKYAGDLLSEDQGSLYAWNKGAHLHDANMVLGRVALRAGDIEGAKAYLIKAGEAPGTGPYSAFGPNMSLAKDLLDSGEKWTVLHYLDLCGKFWKDNGKLAQWKSDIQAGKTPDFRGNLSY